MLPRPVSSAKFNPIEDFWKIVKARGFGKDKKYQMFQISVKKWRQFPAKIEKLYQKYTSKGGVCC